MQRVHLGFRHENAVLHALEHCDGKLLPLLAVLYWSAVHWLLTTDQHTAFARAIPRIGNLGAPAADWSLR